ncbi:hypothetical protein V8B97DRAFT_1859735, partial [Scleroderma yunnanense]
SQISFDNQVEVKCEEFKHNEGWFLLDIARVQFKVCCLKQALAEAKLEETIILGSLYKCQAHEVERRLECAKFDLRHVQNTIWNSGSSLCDVSNKCHHTSSSSIDTT